MKNILSRHSLGIGTCVSIGQSTKMFLYNYNNIHKKIVLVKSCSLSGFKDKQQKLKIIDKEESGRCSLSRTKRNIKELALCNDFEFFYTQTINKEKCDRYNLKEVQELIQKKFKAYKRKYKDFAYIIIYEYHKDGAIHIHGLVKGINESDIYINKNGYLSNSFFDEIGYNSFGFIDDYLKCCNYITKYISKDVIKNEHNQIYFCSKGLKKAEKEDIYVDTELVPWTFENDYVKIYEVFR